MNILRICRRVCLRLGALLLGAAILWSVWVTAGSRTLREAAESLCRQLPLQALRWELGDFRRQDTLSLAAVLTLSESPQLLAARSAVAELWSTERSEQPDPQTRTEELVTRPVAEAPAEAPAEPDNGVPARTLLPVDPEAYTRAGTVCIRNSTAHILDPEALQQPWVPPSETGEGPQILILHTHGSEAYTPAAGTDILWSGDHRTTDSRCNVVRVGDEMANVFSAAGLSVLHDRTLYDYPAYAGAYDRSLAALEAYLERYPSIRFVLDIHRDAVADSSGNQYKLVTETGGTAQLGLVVGSDGSGLPHPGWRDNLHLAVTLQARLLATEPTLMRPVLLRDSRYNQHISPGALLVEVGAAGNAPEEALRAGRLLAAALAELIRKGAA